MNAFLVTGATGVVGSSVLDELIKIPDCRIFILLRPSKDKSIIERKNEVLRFLGISPDEPRIIPIHGDITLERLGLASDDYARLTREVTHVIHCAASLQFDLPREESFKHSVVSVKHVLKLMADLAQPKLDYVSTVGVKGRSLQPLAEDRVSPRQDFFSSYEEGKYLAELEIYRAIDGGLKATIHRPAMIVGHSQTGRIIHFQVFYHLLKLICGRYTQGIIPKVGDVRIDTVPCDFVGQVIVKSALSPDTVGKVIHMCSGFEESILISELQNMTFAAFKKYQIDVKPIRELSFGFFVGLAKAARIFLRGRAAAKLELLPQFLDYAQIKQIFQNAESKQRIAAWGIPWPNPRQYLPTSLDHYVRSYALRDKAS